MMMYFSTASSFLSLNLPKTRGLSCPLKPLLPLLPLCHDCRYHDCFLPRCHCRLHFCDCCLPAPFLLSSAATIATVPTTDTAASVLTSTPSLDNPGIVASSSLSSLVLHSLIFDFNVPASSWSSSSLLLDVALVAIHPWLALFVSTSWLLHLILLCRLPLLSLLPLEVLPPLDKPLPPPPSCHSFAWAALPLAVLLPLDTPMPLVCTGRLLHCL